MSDSALPGEVQRLILQALPSMDHVEVLFRVWQRDDASAEWLAQETRLDPARLAKVLRDLEQSNVIVSRDASYRVTEAPRDRAAVEQFAVAYNTRPVTLIRAIYARPSPVQSFADAFRLRRED
jgi:hypothetical protein